MHIIYNNMQSSWNGELVMVSNSENKFLLRFDFFRSGTYCGNTYWVILAETVFKEVICIVARIYFNIEILRIQILGSRSFLRYNSLPVRGL